MVCWDDKLMVACRRDCVQDGPDLSLSAATRDLKMSTRWSKGTHCGASRRSAARDAGRPATAAVSLQINRIFLKHNDRSWYPKQFSITHVPHMTYVDMPGRT